MGSGPEVEVWQCYASLTDFAKAVSTPKIVLKQLKAERPFGC